jgi:hypothetical protein
MTTHSKLSPSSRFRWSVCPGSVREAAKIPERPSSSAAIDGTHGHFLLEQCIKQGRPASDFIGNTLKDHEGKATKILYYGKDFFEACCARKQWEGV